MQDPDGFCAISLSEANPREHFESGGVGIRRLERLTRDVELPLEVLEAAGISHQQAAFAGLPGR